MLGMGPGMSGLMQNPMLGGSVPGRMPGTGAMPPPGLRGMAGAGAPGMGAMGGIDPNILKLVMQMLPLIMANRGGGQAMAPGQTGTAPGLAGQPGLSALNPDNSVPRPTPSSAPQRNSPQLQERPSAPNLGQNRAPAANQGDLQSQLMRIMGGRNQLA